MIEKESLYFLGKTFNWSILEVKCFNKVLEFYIFVFFHWLDNAGAEMCLLLDLVGLSIDHTLELFLFIGVFHEEGLTLLIGLIKDLEKLLDFVLVMTVSEKILSLVIELVVLLTSLSQLGFDLFRLISCFDNLFLEKHLFPFFFINLQLFFFDGFLVQLRHVP